MTNRNIKKRLPQGARAGRCKKMNKVMYLTYIDAKYDAKLVRKLTKAKVSPYWCKYCTYWHVGHNRPPHRRKSLDQSKTEPGTT